MYFLFDIVFYRQEIEQFKQVIDNKDDLISKVPYFTISEKMF